MAYNAEKRQEVYDTLKGRGYDTHFCELIASQMCTDWIAMRMLGYIRQEPYLKEEDIVDEMLGILADRDRIVQKKEMEFYQSKVNELKYKDFWAEE